MDSENMAYLFFFALNTIYKKHVLSVYVKKQHPPIC